MLLRPFLNDAGSLCQLPVRLHDARQAGGRRRPHRPRGRLPRRGGRDRCADRRGVRDARAGRSRVRPARARRAHGRDRLPAGRRRGRLRACRPRRRRGGRAREHARDRDRDARACARAQRLRGRRQTARRRGAVARLQRRLAPDRRRRSSRPARRRRRARPGAGAAREPAPVARAARPRRPLSEPLRRLGVRPRPLRQPVLVDRLRARPQRAAVPGRPGRVRRRAPCRHAATTGRPGVDRRRQPCRNGGRTGMTPIRLGLRANAQQFAVLVGLTALVGALVGLERSVLPLVGKEDFGLRSSSAILAFVVAFGAAKALTNLAAGDLAERIGRKRLLVIGWLVALPVPLLIGLAPSWWYIVVANLLLGVNQGLAWSMTVVMKIDLAGPRRRGLALGLNEAAGYLGVATAAFATGALAGSFAPRTVIWIGAALIAVAGLLISVFAVRDTAAHVALEQDVHGGRAKRQLRFGAAFTHASLRDPLLRACNQAGLINNLNDALAWGLAPLYLAAHGASVRQIAIVASAYPLVWGAGQLATGWLSDHSGRKPLIVAGMLVQSGALGLLVGGNGSFTPALAAAVLPGTGP